MLNHSRFPAFRKYRRSARWPRAALVFAHACGSLCRLWRQQPTGLTLPSGALRVALGLRPKCPGCSIIRASLTVALMVSLPRFGSLCASRKCPPGTRFPSRHRAHASLRACRGLGQTPGRSIFAEGAGRAHRSFRSPPSGRFATFGGKCPQGTRFPSVPQIPVPQHKTQAFRAAQGRKKRVSPHPLPFPAPPHATPIP